MFFGKKYHIVRYVTGYAVLWLILCLVLTNKYGQSWYDERLAFQEYQVTHQFEEELATFRETARLRDMTEASRKVYILYEMQRLTALATTMSDRDVRTCASYYNVGDDLETYGDRNAYLVIFGDDGR